MIGSLLNAAAIVIGGTAGVLTRKSLSPANELFVKVTLGAFAVFYGLRLTWISLNGTFPIILKQLIIAVLALMLGRLAGRAMGLQRLSNHIGRTAAERMADAAQGKPGAERNGFKICAALFCAAPLAIVGAVLDGLPMPGSPVQEAATRSVVSSGYWYPLLIKSIMEGLGAMAFARLFGWTVIGAALPVLAWQGTITLVCWRWLSPWLAQHALLNSIQATGGLLVFSVALVILQLKKIELADYLPSLIFAPLIAWLWK